MGEREVVFKVCTYNANSLDAPADGKAAASAKGKRGCSKVGAPKGNKADMLAIPHAAKGLRVLRMQETKSRRSKRRRGAYLCLASGDGRTNLGCDI